MNSQELEKQITQIEKHLEFLKSLRSDDLPVVTFRQGANDYWTEDELDEFVDLDLWFATFQEEAQPAKAIIPKGDFIRRNGTDVWVDHPPLTKGNIAYLTKKFRALHGTTVEKAHVFKELGRQNHSSSSGPVLVFACVSYIKECKS